VFSASCTQYSADATGPLGLQNLMQWWMQGSQGGRPRSEAPASCRAYDARTGRRRVRWVPGQLRRGWRWRGRLRCGRGGPLVEAGAAPAACGGASTAAHVDRQRALVDVRPTDAPTPPAARAAIDIALRTIARAYACVYIYTYVCSRTRTANQQMGQLWYRTVLSYRTYPAY
jgi:hypothetical protein